MAKNHKSKPTPPAREQGPPRRYARKPETLLAALGFEINRNTTAQFEAWRLYADFPKKDGNKGLDIEKVEAFLEAHKDEFAQKAARARLVTEGGAVKAVRETLQGFGTATIKIEHDEFPEMVSGMDNLGALIMRRFKDYPSLGEVGRQRIQNWKHFIGVTKRPGLQPFPQPVARNDYRVVDVFDWVTQWIIPDLSKEQGDLLASVDWTNKLKQIEYENKTIEQAQLKGRLMEKAEAKNILSAVVVFGRDKLWELFDSEAYRRFEESIGLAGMPEEWRQIAMTEIRQINPQLLQQYHVHMEQQADVAEHEINGENPPDTETT